MQHCDPDDLTLAAFGTPLDADQAAHLVTCPECKAELDALRRVVAAGRVPGPLATPPETVWERIAADLDAEAGDLAGSRHARDRVESESTAPETAAPETTDPESPEAAATGATAAPESPASDDVPTAPSPTADAAAPRWEPTSTRVEASHDSSDPGVTGRTGGTGSSGDAGVAGSTAAAAGRGVSRRVLTWAIAASIAVGAGGAVVVQQVMSAQQPVSVAEVLSRAQLDALPGWEAAGEAEIDETEGERALVVRLEGGEAEGFRQVWLISEDLTELVSLGVMTGPEATFAVPAGLDLSRFTVVDVSDEPTDGNPAHSGNSIVRGVLQASA